MNINAIFDTFKYLNLFLLTLYILAIYFLVYSVLEFPYSYDIYSCDRLNLCLTEKIILSKYIIYFLYLIKTLSCFLVFIPRYRKISLITLLTTNIIFMFANMHLHSPEQAYLNFLILILINIKVSNSNDDYDKYNSQIIWIYNLVFFIGYSYSGFTKFNSTPWINGSFMLDFFRSNHLVFNDFIYQFFNVTVLRYLTYSVIFIEMFSFLALFNRPLKIFFLVFLTLIQIGLLFTTDLWQVSLGMLICHLFVIDKDFVLFFKYLYLKLFSFFEFKVKN